MTWADLSFLFGPLMFLVAGAGAVLITLGFERWSGEPGSPGAGGKSR